LWVIFALLDPDPDSETDWDPDPKHQINMKQADDGCKRQRQTSNSLQRYRQAKRQTTASTTGKYHDRKMSNMTGGYQIHRQI
jgi:hypothetical protein